MSLSDEDFRIMVEALLAQHVQPDGLERLKGRYGSGGTLDYEACIRELLDRRQEMNVAPLQHRPGHFYSPITDPEQVRHHLESVDRQVEQVPGIELDGERMAEFYRELSAPLNREQPFPDDRTGDCAFWFRNPAYSYGDATTLHMMLRHLKPKRVVEVGSGFSSMCLLETRDRHLDGAARVTFVEPFPERLRSLLNAGDFANTQILEMGVQHVPVSVFTELEAGDLLFIDSTHVLKTGSDVAYELGEVLPRLRPGVVVHFHDIFWPFEYRPRWAVEMNRSWNEVYALRYFLSENPNWDIIMFNDFMRFHQKEVVREMTPWVKGVTGAGIWIRRVGADR
ncbi:class I SAM-dependent methyltransferase [Maricaulis sp. CAU 1757]